MAFPEAFVALIAGGPARAPLNPVTKLALLLPLLAALPVAPAWALGTVGAGCVAAGLALGIGRTMLRRLAVLLLPVALALGIIHGMILPNGAAGLLIVLTTPAQAIASGAVSRKAAGAGTPLSSSASAMAWAGVVNTMRRPAASSAKSRDQSKAA